MSRLLRLLLLSAFATAGLAVPPVLPAESPSQADLLARLTAARETSDLTTAGLRPWHLKSTFIINPAPGAEADSGTLDEWWAAPDQWRLRVDSSHSRATLTSNNGKLFRTSKTGGLPLALDTLRQQLVNPLPSEADLLNAKLSFESKTLAGVKLDCIMVAPASAKRPPFFLYPTFCFDPGTPNLRLISQYGTELIARNHTGHFLGKEVSLRIDVLEEGLPVASTQTQQLATYTTTPTEFDPSSDQEALPESVASVDTMVMAGALIRKTVPQYPREAREYHVTGAVRLKVLIGTDGRIHRLEPISSPDELLTTAAVLAVRQWLYHPYLLNGVATPVETIVTVNFNMSH